MSTSTGEIVGNDAAEPLYVDIAALLAGGPPDAPVPSVLARVDGECLFYRGQLNMLFGEPEAGKTWIALAALAEVLSGGGSGLVADLDHNGAAATVSRLLDFGVPRAILIDSAVFRYAEPQDKSHLLDIVKDAAKWRPDVAIVDSVGELMPLLGLGSNNPDDFTTAHALVLKPLAMSGGAVIAVDHVAKNAASKSQGATGTAAKRRAIGGTSIRVELVETFVPGRGGKARLRVHKDRHGGLRRHCRAHGAEEPIVGIFTMTDENGALTYAITATGEDSLIAVANAVAADIILLEGLAPPPSSQRDVKTRMGWGSDRAMEGLEAWRAKHPNHQGQAQSDQEQGKPGQDGDHGAQDAPVSEPDACLAPRSASAPEEHGAASLDDAPRSATPVSGSAERSESAAYAAPALDGGRELLEPNRGAIELVEGEPASGGTPDVHEPEVQADVDRDDLAPAESPDLTEPDTGDLSASLAAPCIPVELVTERIGEFAACGHPWKSVTTNAAQRCADCINHLPPDPRSGVEAHAPKDVDLDARDLALVQQPAGTGSSA